MCHQKINLPAKKYKLFPPHTYWLGKVTDILFFSGSYSNDNIQVLSRIKHFSPHLISDLMWILNILHTQRRKKV